MSLTTAVTAFLQGYTHSTIEKQAAGSIEDVFEQVKPKLPINSLLASGSLADARGGLSDVDVAFHTPDPDNLLETLPEGTTKWPGDGYVIYSIPGYDREVNLYASADEDKAMRAVRHREIQLELLKAFPQLAATARGYKQGGLGTEPAWAKALGYQGDDPYGFMADKQRALQAALQVTKSSPIT